ncbi:MAG: GNAT family N-acetyltransferase [Chloroflexota bacterium]
MDVPVPAWPGRPQLRMGVELTVPRGAPPTPGGFVIRQFVPGDEQTWSDLLRWTIGPSWTPERLRRDVLSDEAAIIHIATTTDDHRAVVGSACLQITGSRPRLGAYLSLVAVRTSARGYGLGRALVETALKTAERCGATHMLLDTEDHRVTAIGLYLDVGFLPSITDPSHPERWHALSRELRPATRALLVGTLATED